jgi:hypothetical protein
MPDGQCCGALLSDRQKTDRYQSRARPRASATMRSKTAPRIGFAAGVQDMQLQSKRLRCGLHGSGGSLGGDLGNLD